MGVSSRITKEAILAEAFSLVRQGGHKALTARSLAENLSCSTMPIYSKIGKRSLLEEAVALRSLELLKRFQGLISENTTPTLLDIAEGTLRFACQEPALYRTMFLSNDPGQKELRSKMQQDATRELWCILKIQNDRNSQAHLEKLIIFVNGLASTYLYGAVSLQEIQLFSLLKEYNALLLGWAK